VTSFAYGMRSFCFSSAWLTQEHEGRLKRGKLLIRDGFSLSILLDSLDSPGYVTHLAGESALSPEFRRGLL